MFRLIAFPSVCDVPPISRDMYRNCIPVNTQNEALDRENKTLTLFVKYSLSRIHLISKIFTFVVMMMMVMMIMGSVVPRDALRRLYQGFLYCQVSEGFMVHSQL